MTKTNKGISNRKKTNKSKQKNKKQATTNNIKISTNKQQNKQKQTKANKSKQKQTKTNRSKQKGAGTGKRVAITVFGGWEAQLGRPHPKTTKNNKKTTKDNKRQLSTTTMIKNRKQNTITTEITNTKHNRNQNHTATPQTTPKQQHKQASPWNFSVFGLSWTNQRRHGNSDFALGVGRDSYKKKRLYTPIRTRNRAILGHFEALYWFRTSNGFVENQGWKYFLKQLFK